MERMRRRAAPAVALLALLLVAGCRGAADPEPPEEPTYKGGRALWQLGEDGGLKLAGASPPAAPHPKFWTFNHNCKPGVCSELCWERTNWYDAGKCQDNSSGRRYCKCWKAPRVEAV